MEWPRPSRAIRTLLRAVGGGSVLWVVFILVRLVFPAGMGFGDVKIAGLLGIYLAFAGWGPLVVGGPAGFVAAGFFGVAIVSAR